MLFSTLSVAAGLLSLSSAAPRGRFNKRSFSNGPVITSNFPDPSFIKVGDTYHAFATNSGGKNAPHATSTDFASWTVTGDDALPKVGAWSTGANVWASDVLQLPNGNFVLYYTATSTDPSGLHCIGAATASNVEGPYTPIDNSLACPISQGGAIDPAGFVDADGSVYVVYKIDGNAIGSGGNCNNGDGAIPTPLMLQKLADDGVTLSGDPVQVLDKGQYDGPLIEAPSLSRIADSSSAGGWLYFLFFSSNCYAGGEYDSSYAYSTAGVAGPYTKAAAPLVVTGDDGGALYSPGGLDSAVDIGLENRVVFHADLGTTPDTRQMWAGQVNVDVGARTISF